MDIDPDNLLPAAEAAFAANVSRQLFDYWRRSGKIQPAKVDQTGRALYRVGDALDVERDMRNSPQSRRSPYGRPRSSVA